MTDYHDICMSCMHRMQGNPVCPHCGYDPSIDTQMPGALPCRTVLQNRYLIGRAGSAGGEGITYIGFDMTLNIPVRIKEFFPQTMSARSADHRRILASPGSELQYSELLSSSLSYARKVAHLRELSSIVQIYDIFEENNTAYTVAEWQESITLRYFVERSGGSLHWNAARQLFMPVLSGLSAMYESSLGHYGISPTTLSILQDGKMKLGGFCIEEARRMDTALQPDMTPGCAALEQYVADEELTEATDVYGFAATLFFALTGTLPQDALHRRMDARLMIPTAVLKTIPPHVVTALANALQVQQDKRTQTFERLRAELSAAPTVTASIEETQSIKKIAAPYPVRPAERAPAEPPKTTESRLFSILWGAGSFAVAALVFGLIAYFIMADSTASPEVSSGSSSNTSSSVSSGSSQTTSVSVPEGSVSVPNLVGQKYADLKKAIDSGTITDYRLILSKMEFSDSVEEGKIISQSPVSDGGYMTEGDIIVIVVSQGTAERALPEIAGDTLAEATEKLTKLGFSPIKKEIYSDTVEKGSVIGYKDQKVGDKVSYGSQVVIQISLGPDPDKQ